MDKNEIARHANELNALSHEEDGVEYWLARDIMEHMGYSKWENFAKAVQRAKDACANSGQQVEAHFRDTTRNAATVNGGTRVIGDVKLTRYACYLVAQNGDPRKEEVALLQSYFAVQTRTAELLEQRMGEISRARRTRGAGRRGEATVQAQLRTRRGRTRVRHHPQPRRPGVVRTQHAGDEEQARRAEKPSAGRQTTSHQRDGQAARHADDQPQHRAEGSAWNLADWQRARRQQPLRA